MGYKVMSKEDQKNYTTARKRKLKPWVKVALAFIIGVTAVSQVYRVTTGDARSIEKEIAIREALHGVVEMTSKSEGTAYLTIVEKFMGVGEVVVPQDEDDRYLDGDIVTVIYDDEGNITNSYRSTSKEIESLKKNHGATYRALLEKHGRYNEE